MDDIDTRLEAERPEVADVLRSMNWEERLEQARVRRQTVLDRNVADDKRPVVRIIDAAAVARKRADAQSEGPARPVARAVVSPVARSDVVPEPKAAPPAPLEAPAPEAAPTPVRSSTAGRTALGFGLGLGMGASLVAGAFFLVEVSGTSRVPAETATAPVVSHASVPAAPPSRAAPTVTAVAAAPAAATSGPSPSAAVNLARDLAPPVGGAADAAPVLAAFAPGPTEPPVPAGPTLLQPDAVPLMTALPGIPYLGRIDLTLSAVGADGAAPVLAGLAPRPAGQPAPAGPSALAPDTAPVSAAFPVPPAVGRVDLALVAPTVPAEAAPLPAAANAAPRPTGAGVNLANPAGGGNAVPLLDRSTSRPAAVLAPATPQGAPPAVVDIRLPSAPFSHVPAVLPAALEDVVAQDGRPAISVAPPAPPVPEAAEPAIPGAAAMFVRLAVPQSVADAEAEEIAGLLKELGIGDSRVTRVGFKVTESHVRYYHGGDAAAAASLASILGTEARDHTSFRPRPPEGTMEVFLAGERTTPAPRAASTPRRAAPAHTARQQSQPRDETAAMRDRIVNRLRRGEHL